MNILKNIYILFILLALLGVVWSVQMSISSKLARIDAVENGTWHASMGGAGMAMIAPLAVIAFTFTIANALGIFLLIMNSKHDFLKRYEKTVIVISLIMFLLGFIKFLIMLND